MTVGIDFETYWAKDYGVTDAGPWAYVADPRFECYQVAIYGEDRNEQAIEWVGEPRNAPWDRIEGCVWVSHNMTFDAVVWAKVAEKVAVSAPVSPHWYCTANLAVYIQAPRNLAGAAKALLGADLSKEYRTMMKGKHAYELMAYDLDVVRKAGLADAKASYDIWKEHGSKWPLSERNLALMTFQAANRGVHVDWEMVDRSINGLKRLNWEAEQKLPWVAEGKTALSPIAVREQCRQLGIPAPASLAKDSDECVEWEDEFGEKYPFVGAVRVWRRTNILIKKLELIQAMRRPDGTIPAILRYCGAPHTGRWSGDLVNLQNLPREEMFGVSLRYCIVAKPGYVFVIADLAQIEPRILAYLCGNKTLLTDLANGMPLYEAHARETMGWRNGSLKKEDPKLYSLAKARVLGLGYGCSAARFAKVAKNLAGLELSPEECRLTVKDFRKRNPRITGLWKRFDQAIAASARTDKHFEMELPSGRTVHYFDVGYEPTSRNYSACTEQGGIREGIYGAKLVENLVQGTAREVFADILLRLRDAGIEIAFHVHDEVICQVPVERAEEIRQEIEQIMRTPPAWMKDLPLAVESSIAPRYQK
jgi:DNA polymerase